MQKVKVKLFSKTYKQILLNEMTEDYVKVQTSLNNIANWNIIKSAETKY